MRRSKGSDYNVGYGKPPKATRFQPGQSGNPSGRPKGVKGFQQELDAILQEKITVTINGKSRRITILAAIYKQLANGALKGNADSLRLLLNHMARRDINAATAELARIEKEMKPINIIVTPDDIEL
jgi:hypothetical protein